MKMLYRPVGSNEWVWVLNLILCIVSYIFKLLLASKRIHEWYNVHFYTLTVSNTSAWIYVKPLHISYCLVSFFVFTHWTKVQWLRKKISFIYSPTSHLLSFPALVQSQPSSLEALLGYSNHWELTVALAPWLDFTSSAGSPRPGSLGRNVWEKDSVNKYWRV